MKRWSRKKWILAIILATPFLVVFFAVVLQSIMGCREYQYSNPEHCIAFENATGINLHWTLLGLLFFSFPLLVISGFITAILSLGYLIDLIGGINSKANKDD